MITVEYLLNLATEQESLYTELSQKYPPGTVSPERNDAYQKYQKALIAANWMEENNIEKLHHVGCFSAREIRKTDEVVIKARSLIETTHPKGKAITSKKQTIRNVRRIDQGYISEQDKTVVAPKLVWAGAGGYCRWTDLNNVDLRNPSPENKVEQIDQTLCCC